MRISDWSSDVCSSDLFLLNGAWLRAFTVIGYGRACGFRPIRQSYTRLPKESPWAGASGGRRSKRSTTTTPTRWLGFLRVPLPTPGERSEEHTSELQSLMRISYAVFCLKQKKVMYH